jgi:hypothetical protein
MTKVRNARYAAELFGPSWKNGPIMEFSTIREARNWAEEYGMTADKCVITNRSGVEVAQHRRDMNGDGARWFIASVA